jgi:hypothetical protein
MVKTNAVSGHVECNFALRPRINLKFAATPNVTLAEAYAACS